MARVIKLQNGTDTLLPISDATAIQMTVDNNTKSVQDVILENEEIFAAAMTDLNSQLQDIQNAGYITAAQLNEAGYLSSFTETDPSIPSYVRGITESDISYWNGKSELFTINFVYNGLSITSCDKTFAQIKAAHDSGKILQAVINNGFALGNVTQVTATAIFFNVVDTQNNNTIVSYELGVYDNDTYIITVSTIYADNYLTEETDPTVPSYVKGITESDITNWNNKQDALVSGTNIKTINSSSILGSGNIDLLTPNFCPIIEDTRSSNAGNITGVAPFNTLVDKQKVIIHLAYTTGNYTTLELTLNDGVTTTNAIPIYARTDSTWVGQILDGHFRGGTYMELIYNSSENRWYCLNLDRDTTTWAMSQTEINNASSTDPRSVPSAKLLCDNFTKIGTFNNFCPIIEDTRSSNVDTITGVAPFATLANGQIILLHLAYGTTSGTKLKLTLSGGTDTAAINVMYSNLQAYTVLSQIGGLNTTAGMYLHLIYNGTNWIAIGFGDGNTQYAVITQSDLNTGTATASKTITAKLLRDNFYLKSETAGITNLGETDDFTITL